MLGTTDLDRLHRWYTTALPPKRDVLQEPYRILEYGGFWLFLDPRGDVQPTHPDPARTLLNFDVADAAAVVAAIDRLGTPWVAPLEDRDGSLFATAQDPDGNYVQIIQLSPRHRAEMSDDLGAAVNPTDSTQVDPGLRTAEAFSGFSVDDLDAAQRFYSQVLGVTVERHPEPMSMLSLKLGDRAVLVYPKEDHAPATYTVLNFPSDDVAASVRALTERGVTFERYDGMQQDELGVHTGGGPLIAWFTDPAGNVLSVIARE